VEHLLIAIAAALAAILIAEVVASIRFSRWYFAFGIPLFIRRIERPAGIADLSFETLQTSAKTVAGAPYIFQRLAPNRIAFREKVFAGAILYFPLMRGVIRHEPGEAAVKIVGLLNWTFLAIPLAFLAAFGTEGVHAFGYIGFACAVLYLIQGVRYWRLGNGLRSA
jgi:hypothetical protein